MYPWHGAGHAPGENSHPHPVAHQHPHQHHHPPGQPLPGSSAPGFNVAQQPQMRWLPPMMARNGPPQAQMQQHPQAQRHPQQQVPGQVMGRTYPGPIQPMPGPGPGPAHGQAPSQSQDTRAEENMSSTDDNDNDNDSANGDMRMNTSSNLDAPGDPDFSTPPENQSSSRGTNSNASACRRSSAAGQGKRLTTSEEVVLFNICNAHASTFGQRSNLCKWWQEVTSEFTSACGHTYSWHSVRRKVETATKQRMRFLDEMEATQALGEEGRVDVSNARWREAVDRWIPTWKKWEENEMKRIRVRDTKRDRKRKRKSRVWDAGEVGQVGGDAAPAPPTSTSTSGVPMSMPMPASTPQTAKLPPGFDSMFTNQTQSPPTPRTGWFAPPQPNPQLQPQTQSPHTPNSTGTGTGTDPQMMTAMLETLNKLNKRLDSAPPNPRSSPVISALVSTGQGQTEAGQDDARSGSGSGSGSNEPIQLTAASLASLKDELRREMRRELEKDRAGLEEKLDAVQRTQDMILEMLRQEP